MRNRSAGVAVTRSGRRIRLILPPRTPEQEARRRFLLAPISTTVYTRSYPWAGMLIPDGIPESGRKVSARSSYMDDEEFYARHADD